MLQFDTFMIIDLFAFLKATTSCFFMSQFDYLLFLYVTFGQLLVSLRISVCYSLTTSCFSMLQFDYIMFLYVTV